MIKDRESLLAFLNEAGSVEIPILECEFTMTLNLNGAVQKLILDSFSIPNSGITFNNDSGSLGFIIPSYSVDSIEVAYHSKPSQVISSPIHEWYESQFTKDGLLKDTLVLPTITISASVKNSEVILFSLAGCRTTYPVPSVSPKSSNFSVFRSRISYNDFTYGKSGRVENVSTPELQSRTFQL